ncbi:MAG: DNA polymerase III subunit delta [Firmicutes bacterium]|nr:DNA polymerase III subunit delta [Bacillota bacterium]
MQFSELKKHLNTNNFAPAYIVVGEDSFLVQTALRHFKATVQSLPELNISVFSESAEAVELISSLLTMPMGSDIRLTICYDIKGDTTALEQYFTNFNPQSILIVVSKKLPENLSKLLHHFTVVDCTKLEIDHIKRWVNTELSATNSNITQSAFMLLYNYCLGNMERISIETKKLGFYKMCATIEDKDVIVLIEPSLEHKIFELSEAVANKNSTKTVHLVEGLLAEKYAPIMLIGMIYNHFRRLLYCKIDGGNSDLAKQLAVKDFAITKAKQGANRFTAMQLKQICDDFHTLDYKSKIGQINDITALKRYIMRILKI